MNYKLEKFWNGWTLDEVAKWEEMNYKLEKFWNLLVVAISIADFTWTINLKSFEITVTETNLNGKNVWTINLKSFEMVMKF